MPVALQFFYQVKAQVFLANLTKLPCRLYVHIKKGSLYLTVPIVFAVKYFFYI